MDHAVHMNHQEDEGLWDELNHQQSREIAQHEALMGRGMLGNGISISNHHHHHRHHHHRKAHLYPAFHLESIRQLVRQTQNESRRLYHIIREATTSSWKEHRQKHYTDAAVAARQDHHHEYLDEFGIPQETVNSNSAFQYAHLNNDGNDNENDRNNPRRFDTDFEIVPQLAREQQWEAAANLDVYFSSLYNYYYHRGFVPIATKGAIELIGLFFTLVLSVFLFAYVDWIELSACIDEATCQPHFVDYVHKRPFAWPWSGWILVVILYAGLFSAYGCFSAWSYLHTLRQATASQCVFEERLGISSRKLQGGAVDWDMDVVQKLRALQTSGEYRIVIHSQSDKLDALAVAGSILRKENFVIALFNCGILDLSVPIPFLRGEPFFCSSIEWVLHFAVLNFLYNHKYQIRPAFYLDPGSLRRRFIFCGITHALFLPFLLFFLVLHFGFSNLYDWKNTKQYLGPREWSLHSRWLFREFNELPHHFERRLAPSYRATEDYLKLFGQNELVTAVGRIVVFIGGSLGTVLFVFAAMNDAILLHVKIYDWNLLWYAGVVGVAYSIGKSMIPSNDSTALPRNIRNLFAETDAALVNIAKYTHYYMETWKGRGADAATLSCISSMFRFKANGFFMEVISMVVAPYVLCVSLARCAESICEFIFAVKDSSTGHGDICGFASFDFDMYSDEAWEGKTMGKSSHSSRPTLAESIIQTGSTIHAANLIAKPKTRHGKMEKSFFSFKASHPNWQCSASGQNLVDRVERYEREEMQAFNREQQLHIEGAAQQLEMLARLERRHEGISASSLAAVPVENLNEFYIPKTLAPADAGAGLRRHVAHEETHPHPSSVSALPEGSSPESQLLTNRIYESPLQSRSIATTSSFVSSPAQESPRSHPQSPLFSTSSSNHSAPCRNASLTFMAATASNASMAPRLPPGGSGSGNITSSLGLSMELRRLLNMSMTLVDPDISAFMRSAHPELLSSVEQDERRGERQYMWLERYHAHMNAISNSGNVASPEQQLQSNQNDDDDNNDLSEAPLSAIHRNLRSGSLA